MSTTNKYLWQKEVIDYTEAGVADKVTVLLIAVYGDQGIQGPQGEQGIQGIQGPVGPQGPQGNGYILIESTQTSNTASWTGTTSEISTLVSGQQILFHLNKTSAANVTLNLTLSGGTTTGAKNVFYVGTTRLGTQYASGAMVPLVYNGTAWYVVAPYTDTDNDTYDRTKYSNAIKASAAISAGKIIIGDQTGYRPVAAGATFNIAYPILYAGSAISSAGTGSNNYIYYPSANLTTTVSGASVTSYQMVYLVGTLDRITDEDGNFLTNGVTFTIDSTTVFANAPTTEDGKYYIPIGTSYSTTQIYFTGGVPVLYAYKGGRLVRYPNDDIYTVTVTQESHTSSITNLTTGQIALEANYTNITEQYEYLNGQVDTLNTNVETQTARIDVLSNEITQKVTSSDVDTMINTATGQMKTDIKNLQESALTINSEGITSLVSRVDSLEDINESTAFKVQSDGAYVYYGYVNSTTNKVELNQTDYTKIDQAGQHVYHNSQEVAWNTVDGTGSPKMSIGNSSSDAQRWTFSMDGDLLNIRWIDS